MLLGTSDGTLLGTSLDMITGTVDASMLFPSGERLIGIMLSLGFIVGMLSISLDWMDGVALISDDTEGIFDSSDSAKGLGIWERILGVELGTSLFPCVLVAVTGCILGTS
jgi:hypothetical protein